jgi:hypothetical protein
MHQSGHVGMEHLNPLNGETADFAENSASSADEQGPEPSAGGRGGRRTAILSVVIVLIFVALAMKPVVSWLGLDPIADNAPDSSPSPTISQRFVPDATPQPTPTVQATPSPASTPEGVATAIRSEAGVGVSVPATPRPASPTPRSSSPTELSGATPTVTAEPTATATPELTAGIVIAAVAAAESDLRTGTIDASITYAGASSSAQHVAFDFGRDGSPAMFHLVASYTGTGGTRQTETLRVGTQTWERQADGTWHETTQQLEGAWGQIQGFLPHLASDASAELSQSDGHNVLRWYDPARDADVTLEVDGLTDVPARMIRVSRATGVTLNVVYTGWNSPVSIDSPGN